MITNFQLFESPRKYSNPHFQSVKRNDWGFYWSIRTDSPYFEIGLTKIGMPKNTQEEYVDMFNSYASIYIAKKGKDWSWSDYESIYRIHFRNMGKVEITKEELEEWELNKTASKYNL